MFPYLVITLSLSLSLDIGVGGPQGSFSFGPSLLGVFSWKRIIFGQDAGPAGTLPKVLFLHSWQRPGTLPKVLLWQRPGTFQKVLLWYIRGLMGAAHSARHFTEGIIMIYWASWELLIRPGTLPKVLLWYIGSFSFGPALYRRYYYDNAHALSLSLSLDHHIDRDREGDRTWFKH